MSRPTVKQQVKVALGRDAREVGTLQYSNEENESIRPLNTTANG